MILLDFSRLAPWRRRVQWLSSALILLIPFVRYEDRSLLRLNIPARALEVFGTRFRIEELYLFLLVCLAGLLLFLLLTMILGRVWCGWGCPQTTLVDLIEWVAKRLKLKQSESGFSGPMMKRATMQGLYLFLSLLIGANLVWYCIPPVEFFSRLLVGDLGFAATFSVLIVAFFVWLDLAFLRRTFCKEFCPYGRFQTTLVDPGTLTLRFHPDEAERCIKCGACVRTCPTGIDIRKGYQIECINCGRCLDACRNVMAKRQQPGIIRYTFGTEGKGPAALLNIRVLLLTVAVLALSAVIVFSVLNRTVASLKVQRSTSLAPRILKTGERAIFYTGYIKNQSGQTQRLRIKALTDTNVVLELRGPVSDIELQAGERTKINFILLLSEEDKARQYAFLALRNSSPEPLDTVTLTLPVYKGD